MINPLAPHVLEREKLLRLAEAEPVGCQDMKRLGQVFEIELPSDFRTSAELSTMKQHEQRPERLLRDSGCGLPRPG
jgi:hypothetical protein